MPQNKLGPKKGGVAGDFYVNLVFYQLLGLMRAISNMMH